MLPQEKTVPVERRTGEDPLPIYIASLAERSRRVAFQRLRRFAQALTQGAIGVDQLPWHQVGSRHIEAVQRRLLEVEALAPATCNAITCTVRGLLKTCWQIGLLTEDQRARACDVRPLRASRLPPGRSLSAGELKTLFDICEAERGPSGARDGALLAVLYGCGLRRAEAAALDLSDYDSGSLKVHGKGGKQRAVYLPPGAVSAVEAWLELRGDAEGPLFCRTTKGSNGAIIPRGISEQAIYAIVAKRARQAGLEKFSPHDLRRSFCSDMLDAGADTLAVQRLMGHSSPVTTSRYDRRPEEAKKKAADLLHVPFNGTHRLNR